jgi:hypothetical protein
VDVLQFFGKQSSVAADLPYQLPPFLLVLVVQHFVEAHGLVSLPRACAVVVVHCAGVLLLCGRDLTIVVVVSDIRSGEELAR